MGIVISETCSIVVTCVLDESRVPSCAEVSAVSFPKDRARGLFVGSLHS